MNFVKMHGIGNDYVYLDAVNEPALEQGFDGMNLSELARRVSDRHKGIGSDGLILICNPTQGVDAHVRMRMLNADGSEAEMCGNGVRCVAKFAHDRLGIDPQPMLIETERGVLTIGYDTVDGKVTSATVDMGEPILEFARIPVDASCLKASTAAHEYEIDVDIQVVVAGFVSMGNPHAISFTDGAGDVDLETIGPRIEQHRAFPNRINAHFVQISSKNEATMKTWERGTGATQACGTGACAVLVAGVRTGRLDRQATLHLPGGNLHICWDEKTNHVFMTGPAEDVFEGVW